MIRIDILIEQLSGYFMPGMPVLLVSFYIVHPVPEGPREFQITLVKLLDITE